MDVVLHRLGEGVGGLLLPPSERVGLDVRRNGHAGVPQAFADDDDVLAVLQGNAGVKVGQALPR